MWRRRRRATLDGDMYVHPEISQALARERQREAIGAAASRRRMRRQEPAGPSLGDAAADEIKIRFATAADATPLRNLAALDEAPPLEGAILVAEVAGGVLAACSLSDGRAIADPFRQSEPVKRLLELRRRQLVVPDRRGRARARRVLRQLRFGS